MTTSKTTSKTSTRTTLKAKPATKPRATKPAASGVLASATESTPKPTVVSMAEPVVTGQELKKSELVDMIVERSGVKKKYAKPVVEAMLATLGETIAEGRELNLQPFGKLKVNRSQDKANAQILICKLRRNTNALNDDSAPLAEPAE